MSPYQIHPVSNGEPPGREGSPPAFPAAAPNGAAGLDPLGAQLGLVKKMSQQLVIKLLKPKKEVGFQEQDLIS